MGFDTEGYVLKAARSAPCNATGTAPAGSGVSREHTTLPGSYDLPGTLVEVAADQYRSAVIDHPSGEVQEYLLWAANSSNLAVLEDSSWAIDQGTGTIPQGSTIVLSATTDTVGVGGFVAGVAGVSNPTVVTVGLGTFVAGSIVQVSGANTASNDGLFEVLSHVLNLLTIRGVGLFPTQRGDTGTQFVTDTVPTGTITQVAFIDGTDKVVVTDDDDRSIAGILSIIVVRGDDVLNLLTFTTFASQDADAGLLVLDAAALTALGGGLSRSRGDTVLAVFYYLAAQKFWWTRNDSVLQRFGWNGLTQRWEPFRGSKPVRLGEVREDADYTLTPHPSRFSVGDYLPGDSGTPDARAIVRVGRLPDSDSTPVGVLVVSDEDAAETYPSWPVGVDAVVGVSSGVLQWNPTYVATNAGQVAWYVPETFAQKSDGVVGELKGAGDTPLFICPVPGLTDYPFIRFGSRRYLRAVMADTDADLDVLVVAEGEVGWSFATGKLKFNDTDIAKADPDDAGFDLSYLGAVVVYDGVSLTPVPVGTRAPVQVVDSTGTPTTVDGFKEFFIPSSSPLPSPGVSGVRLVPDDTGMVPDGSVVPSTRSNGSGLVRQVAGAASGDNILFGMAGCVEKVEVVEFDRDLPLFPFLLAKGRAVAARELHTSGAGSRVAVGLADRVLLGGQPLYFVQADVQPAVYATQARLVSRVVEPYTFVGGEVFAFAVDGMTYSWVATAGSYDADTVAASLMSVVTGTGIIYGLLGRVVIEAGDTDTGSVEVGFGSTGSGAFAFRDLSGCSALGFPPGWRVSSPGTDDNWLPDSGLSFGVSRSPKNLDRTQEQADFKARGRFRDAVLSRSVIASPVFFVNNPPLVDVAGYDDGVFFQVIEGSYRRSLLPFEDVFYDFEQGRFSWLSVGGTTAGVSAPLTSLDLGGRGVVGLTLHPAVGNGYGLYTDEAGSPFVLQTLDTDYLLDQGGQPGVATLIERVGDVAALGARGMFTSGGTTFTDVDATFLADGVAAGYLLEVTSGAGTAVGSYVVASVTGETMLEVAPAVPFPEDGDSVPWEIRVGFTDAVYDPALLADVVYEEFNHLPDEPFKVRVLSPLGATPVDEAAQSAGRLNAVVAEALKSGRPISVRFGQDSGNPEASLVAVRKTKLGTVANGSLFVPDATDAHFTTAAFSVRVGAQSYEVGTNLTGVTVFSDPLSGDQVEYGLPASGIEGQLNFGETTLDELEESLVYYVQEFTDPAGLSAGEAEVDPTTGDLNLSAVDMASYGGEEAYFVEQMITEGREDVVIGPMQGAVFFHRPLRAMQLVEVSYYQADVSGQQVLDEDGNPTEIVEFLPLYVRLEEATFTTDYEWAFNPTGRTVRGDIPSQVWVDNRLQNYENVPTCTVVADESVLRFTKSVSSGSVVKINYAVNETFGGEQGFTVSTRPVYRPPFFLLADESTFELETDRTTDMVPGKLLRLGATPFYVKSSTYDATTDVTMVGIFPTPDREAGSRAPGNDVLTLLSAVPVATDVDGVATSAAAGFLLTLTADYEPVDAGMVSVIFKGNVTRYAVAGHLLEFGGYPLICAGSQLSQDGLSTSVHFTSPFLRGFDPTVDVVKVSVRPVYPPGARNFLGLAPVVPTEPVRVVLYGEAAKDGTPLPGRTLVRGAGYDFTEATGAVSFLAPMQAGLEPDQRVLISFTRLRALTPILQDDTVVIPRYRAKYAHIVIPDAGNGFLNAYLVGTYTFASPDSFYVRTLPLSEYLGEVAKVAADRVAARTPHGGPMVVSGPALDNWQFGTVPLLAQERELRDQDRAARVFIGLYDTFVQAFEQVKEAIDGGVVGDRDGKFRFFVGRNKTYGGPGYEDDITGELVPRFVWSQVFEAAQGSFGVAETDPIVDPSGAVQDPLTLEVSGDPMNPWLLDYYVQQQKRYVLNDMDDLVLAGKGIATFVFPFSFKVAGDFRQMWEPSTVSRLYPEKTLAFTTTYPGLLAGVLPGVPGVYAFLKLMPRPALLGGSGPVLGSTFGMDIGNVSNPAIGIIQNITGQVKPRARLARARIWAYSETGFKDIDPLTEGIPSVLATPLFLRDFPIDQSTGLPVLARLAAQGGDLQDLSTGDYSMSTPKWATYDAVSGEWVGYSDLEGRRPQVALGRPGGDTYSVAYVAETLLDAFSGALPFTDPVYKGLFVHKVYSGCIISFTGGGVTGEITNAADIARVDEDGVGTLPFAPVYGDTIYVIPPGSEDASGFSDPPSVADLEKFAAQQPSLDVGVRERRSTFVDWSLPSIKDPSPFPIKEIVNQRTASPLMPIEADVEFSNTMRDPLKFPALHGLGTNDSGDYTLPYLTSTNTELDRLGAVQATFTTIVQTDSPTPESVYPDEVVGNDGGILSAVSGSTPPATLLTSRDFLPVTTAGVYTPHTGIADVRRYDLLLVETGTVDVPAGVQGILSVGEVTSGTLEVPRFVTPSPKGSQIRYKFDNVMTRITGGAGPGMLVEEVAGTTTFDITALGGLFFNDGSGVATGGLNGIVDGLIPYGAGNDNIVTIEIIDQWTGNVLETIVLTQDGATGGLGLVSPIAAAPTFTDKVLTVDDTGFVSFANLGGVAPGPVGPFDFKISVDAYNAAGLGASTGTDTAYVDDDRLTFIEDMDFRTVMPRGSTTVNPLVSVQGELSVFRVTAGGVTPPDCTVNSPTTVNGGDPFTFLERDTLATYPVGTFDPSPGTEEGSVKVMSFEGDNNTPLPSTGSFTFSAMASSDQDATGVILAGTGSVYDDEDRVRGIPTPNDLAKVEPGDVLVITESSVGDAAVTCGSYVIRHAVPDDGLGYAEVFPTAAAGASSGWVKSPFPKVVSAVAGTITTTALQTVSTSPSGYDFAAAGRLYLILDINDLTTVVSVEYTPITPVGDNFAFTLTGGTGLAADGVTAVADGDVITAAGSAQYVSGMVYVPIGQFPSPCPSNNTVGFGNGVSTAGGLVQVLLKGGGGSQSLTGATLVDSTPGAPAAGELGVTSSDATTTNNSTVFLSDVTTPVYQGVPLYLDFTGIVDPTVAFWAAIHGGVTDGVACLVPGMTLYGHDGSKTAMTGFRAQAGVFIEPSTPRPTFDLGNGVEKVVDAGHSIGFGFRVGMRSPSSFGIASPETVSFSVRRVRRWHEVLDGIGENLAPLRFAYEIRRGTPASYVTATRTFVAAPDPDTLTGTQLGGFDDRDVNVNPGDVLRILDGSGTLLDSAEVAVVVGGTTLVLRSPGLTYTFVGGEVFQVYLRQAPVPHEQSNEQLLEIITDEVVFTSTANPVTGDGGRSETMNFLMDPSVVDFTTLGIEEGDIVLVDPAGELAGATGAASPVEFGMRPIGDQSVSTRGPGLPYIAGGPSDLDDNRGWYRVVAVTASEVEVSGETDFTGPDGSPVILGSTALTNQQFTVYPDIHASGLDPYGHGPGLETEGQMDLRITKPALPSNSYQDGSFKSIEPFSYRIIRPTRLVSADTVDLILMFRERMLSWMEEMAAATKAEKQGSYFVFQEDEHCADLGSATDGDDGLGVPSNVFITGLSGLTQYAPFANTSDCLSVLDRRNWCLDTRLDREVPPWVVGADPYTSLAEDNSVGGYTVGSGRPVEPDLIDGVLDRTDRLRDLRYAWVKFRANRDNGTLPSIDRFLLDLPRLLQEQADFLRLQQSISDAGGS